MIMLQVHVDGKTFDMEAVNNHRIAWIHLMLALEADQQGGLWVLIQN